MLPPDGRNWHLISPHSGGEQYTSRGEPFSGARETNKQNMNKTLSFIDISNGFNFRLFLSLPHYVYSEIFVV
jgi:hypothetical protein